MAFRDEKPSQFTSITPLRSFSGARNSPQSRRYARLVAPIIERIDSGSANTSMRVLIRLTAPFFYHILAQLL